MKIIVVACDHYADAAPAWVYLWRTYWSGCDYEAVFVANKRKLAVDLPVVYLRGNDINFGWRLRTYLREHYTDEHLLIHMVDYFIQGAEVETIRQAHQLCALPGVRHVRLRPMPPPPFPYPADGFGRIDKSRRYSLSLQPGIWRTETLYKLLRDGENPWVTEIQGSLRVPRMRGEFLSVDHYALPHLNYYHKGAAKGLEWVCEHVPADKWPDAVKERFG